VNNSNGERLSTEPPANVVGCIADLGTDIATLAELQARLAIIDLREATKRATVPGVVVATSLALGTASLPVLLIGAAEILAAALRLGQKGWAYLVVATLALVVALATGALASARLVRSFEEFRRTREEFARNLAWVKTVIVNRDRLRSSRR